MESLLHQSRAMCPFLKKTSPATLRSLSSTAAIRHASAGGGTMSNLQVLARRCPVMGKALTVQSARNGASLGGVFGGARAYHSKGYRANLHTSSAKQAQVHHEVPRNVGDGKHVLPVLIGEFCIVEGGGLKHPSPLCGDYRI